MKRLICFLVILLSTSFVLLQFGCLKDEADVKGSKAVMTLSICDCIDLSDPANPVYCEMTQQEFVTWGNAEKPFSKTIDILYYNTRTHFVLKVKSTSGWSDLVIDGISVWVQGPVAADTWGEYTVELPIGWEADDDYDFSLQVSGNGPPAIFQVEYLLVGECEEDGTVTDINGNVYQTVVIGTQTWMKENLKTTKYNDGTPIPHVTSDSSWASLTSGAYCWYNNDESTYKNPYGALYNWNAVTTDKLCPTGWHVPSDAEWTILTDFLGGEGVAGGPLKETGTAHWNSPNAGATNASGFTALPGGFRNYYYGDFYDIRNFGTWWSSSAAYSSAIAWVRILASNYSDVYRDYGNNEYGFSVRCLRDN